MKKLKLKLDGMKDMLTKEQMKKITGGYAVLSCLCSGFDYFTVAPSDGHCPAHFNNWCTAYYREHMGYGYEYATCIGGCQG